MKAILLTILALACVPAAAQTLEQRGLIPITSESDAGYFGDIRVQVVTLPGGTFGYAYRLVLDPQIAGLYGFELNAPYGTCDSVVGKYQFRPLRWIASSLPSTFGCGQNASNDVILGNWNSADSPQELYFESTCPPRLVTVRASGTRDGLDWVNWEGFVLGPNCQ